MSRLATATKDDIQIETRQRLLESAAKEFAQNGFAGANINHISTTAGFAKGTIYNYFPSKRELMLALIDEIAAQHINFIVQQIEPLQNSAQRLRGFFSAGYDLFSQYPHISHVAINVIYGHDVEFKDRMYQAYQGLFTLLIEDIIGAGITQGDFRPVNPNETAALLMSLYLGSCSLLDAEGNVWFKPDQVMTFVLDGLRPRRDSDTDKE